MWIEGSALWYGLNPNKDYTLPSSEKFVQDLYLQKKKKIELKLHLSTFEVP